ncbi:MAG: hypothetical protein IJ229_12770, partial [Clostridia bacterium]|nr:hypothetical protein [Clostridia bacterium]
ALKDAQGKKRTTVPGFTVLPVLEEGETTVRVRYGTVTGLIDKSRVEVSTLGTISYTLGKLALNGSVSGRAKIRVRETPGGRLLGEYATGTQVTVFGEEDGSLAIEIEGRRGYVQSEYVLPEEEGV